MDTGTRRSCAPAGRALSRRGALRTATGLAALPALAAVSGCGSESSSSGGKPSLRLVYHGDATQQNAFNQLFAAFHTSHPDIEIKAQGIATPDWATFAQTVSTQIAGGKVPDIVDVATEGQRLFASKGLLEPLDAYMARDQKTVDSYFADSDPRLRKWTDTYGSTDGRTYFVPGGYNTVVMYCNTKLFERAGVDLPDDGWSWDDFRRAGQRVKERTGAFLLPAGYAFPFVDVLPWLLTNGASTFNADWDKPTFASPQAIEAATFVKSLIDDGLSPKPGGTFDAAAQMQKDKLATLGGGRWPTLDVRRLKMLDKVRIVKWPTRAGDGSPVGWDGWPILKASANKDAAWTFLKWMMSPQASEFYAKIGGTNVPARGSVSAGDDFLGNAPKGTEVLAGALKYGTPIPSPIQGAQAEAAITRGWQAAITGTKPVADALKAADRQLGGLV